MSNASDIHQGFHRCLPDFQTIYADSKNLNSKTGPHFAGLVRDQSMPLNELLG
jgi:hypothetical protein